MPLIDDVLDSAEKDISINDILRYIVTINKDLIFEINDSKNIETINAIFSSFYTCWLGLLTMELAKLTIDCCRVPDHYVRTSKAINVFKSENNFPEMGKKSLPANFLQKMNDQIASAQSASIQPFNDTEVFKDNYIFQQIKDTFQKQTNLSTVVGTIKGKRIFDLKPLQASTNFQNALTIIKEPLNTFVINFKSDPPNVQTTTSSSFDHSFSTSKKATVSTNKEATVRLLAKENEYANLSLTQALQKYIALRRSEKKYHFWGSLFEWTGKPFSLADKEAVVAKIIYWKKRILNEIVENSKDAENQFLPRDIAACQDHRLGRLCDNYETEIAELFQFANSKKSNNQILIPSL